MYTSYFFYSFLVSFALIACKTMLFEISGEEDSSTLKIELALPLNFHLEIGDLLLLKLDL